MSLVIDTDLDRTLAEVDTSGAEGQTRTVDTGIFSAVLYHLSYLGRQELNSRGNPFRLSS